MNRTAIALALPALLVSGAASAATYTVTIEDLVVGGPATGQPITPPVAVVHDASYSLFAPGSAATPGLEIVAEEGMPTTLVEEAEASPGVSFVIVGSAGPFFDSVQFTIEGDTGDLFSVVGMLARSNDLITGVHDIELPEKGAVVMMTNAYDAGTEVNTGLVQDIPFYGNGGVGPDEDGVVALINSYSVLDDPDEGRIDYTFPPVARVTIEREEPTPVESVTWGQIKDIYAR